MLASTFSGKWRRLSRINIVMCRSSYILNKLATGSNCPLSPLQKQFFGWFWSKMTSSIEKQPYKKFFIFGPCRSIRSREQQVPSRNFPNCFLISGTQKHTDSYWSFSAIPAKRFSLKINSFQQVKMYQKVKSFIRPFWKIQIGLSCYVLGQRRRFWENSIWFFENTDRRRRQTCF